MGRVAEQVPCGGSTLPARGCIVSTVPYRLEAWKVINTQVNRKLAERLELVRAALNLLAVAQAHIAAGRPEFAADAIDRARSKLTACIPRDAR